MEQEAQGWPAFQDHTQEKTILAFFLLFEINMLTVNTWVSKEGFQIYQLKKRIKFYIR